MVLNAALHLHLPLRESAQPTNLAARAATATVGDPFVRTSIRGHQDASVVAEFGIRVQKLDQVFFSSSPYNNAFKEHLDMRHFYPTNQPSGGMHFTTSAD
jgi:hypothetical protein